MRLCYQQASYGYEYLAPVVSDFPRPGTQCALKVGRRQIVLEHQEDGGRDQVRFGFSEKNCQW
jgi:hypothetical protein